MCSTADSFRGRVVEASNLEERGWASLKSLALRCIADEGSATASFRFGPILPIPSLTLASTARLRDFFCLLSWFRLAGSVHSAQLFSHPKSREIKSVEELKNID